MTRTPHCTAVTGCTKGAVQQVVSNGESPRVLIVDDDPGIRLLCSVSLELEGFVVLEAPDGARGLERARSERPDLVVTDVAMPGLDGFQLADALRCDRRTRRIPLIFLSAQVGSEDVARARGLGALDYVTKPFDPIALASRLVAALADAREGEKWKPDRSPH